jgi:hypothetical protein
MNKQNSTIQNFIVNYIIKIYYENVVISKRDFVN